MINKSLCKTLAVMLLALVSMPLATVRAQDGGTQNPAGYPVNQALYLTMRDGVRIAVDVWLPADLRPDSRIPTMLHMTRYWRSIQNLPPADYDGEMDMAFVEAGYAVVLVDARGSGASEGSRPIEWSPDEVADYSEIVDWIVAQPWSNGRVGAFGISYDSNAAELLTVNNHPAVRAVALLFGDFDPLYTAAMPGGLLNPGFIQAWSEGNAALDANDICVLAETENEAECALIKQIIPGVKRVDADPDGVQLDQIVAARANPDIFEYISNITYRDDMVGDSGYTIAAISPYALRTQIETSNVPMYVWTGWFDAATVEGALSRYMTFSNPQQVIIGPWDHGAAEDIDPFMPMDKPVEPSPEDQFQMLLAWFDPLLRGDGEVPKSGITYYTMNAGTWTTVDTWPPAGFDPQPWYFGGEGMLSPDLPVDDSGADTYEVDFTVSAGPRYANRWSTQFDGEDIVYPDRAEQDTHLLTYTSNPLEADVEITGSPVVTVYLTSTHDDGALHIYLEAVAPDGSVIYLTEGVLRLIHRVSEEEPPFAVFGPYHSYNRADAAPLVPGETTEISLTLLLTSIVVPQGYRLRVAIAGADANMFARYPAEGDPVLTVERNSVYPSHIMLPMAELLQSR